MAAVQYDQMRTILQAQRAGLQHVVERLEHGIEHDPEALADSLRETIRDVEDALARLDNGTFGTCEQCKQVISYERLAEQPATRLCVTCAEARATVITADPEIE